MIYRLVFTISLITLLFGVATYGVLVVGLKVDGSVVAVGERYERYEVSENNNWPGANVLDVSNISDILVPTIHVE